MTAKYLEIVYKLELEIRQMRLDGRTKLPSEAELCSLYSSSRQTVRAALDKLEAKGLIVKRKGSGSYLAGSIQGISNTVVFITEDEDEYTNPAFITHLEQLLRNNKYDLVCRSTDGLISKENKILTDLLSDHPAAVIIEPISNIVPDPNIRLIGQLYSEGIPIIYFRTSYPEPSGAPLIGEDNKQGASILVRHLMECGHRDIAGIFRCDDSRGLERYQGYYEALSDLNLRFDENSVCMFTASDRRRLLHGDDELLQRFIGDNLGNCTAVICQNDEIAYRLIRLLESRGISVPGTVVVVSFDDSYYASQGQSGITSLGHSNRNMSSIAADTVIAAIRNKKSASVNVEWRLKIRGSG